MTTFSPGERRAALLQPSLLENAMLHTLLARLRKNAQGFDLWVTCVHPSHELKGR